MTLHDYVVNAFRVFVPNINEPVAQCKQIDERPHQSVCALANSGPKAVPAQIPCVQWLELYALLAQKKDTVATFTAASSRTQLAIKHTINADMTINSPELQILLRNLYFYI